MGEKIFATLNCLGVKVAQPSFSEFLAWFDEKIGRRECCATLAIVNAHTLNLACQDPAFRTALNAFSMVLNDGAGLELYGNLASKRFHHNFNGTDLLPTIFEHRSRTERTLRLFLYGAKPGVAALAAAAIEKRSPFLKIVGVQDGYTKIEESLLVSRINDASPDLLLVALGNPLQELWIQRNANNLKVGVACGIGALLDFLSGTVPRAPLWMRLSRLEWLFRLALEPRRMAKRYLLGNPLFIWRTLVFLLFNRENDS